MIDHARDSSLNSRPSSVIGDPSSPEEPRPWVEGLTIGAVLRETARRFAALDAIVFPQAGVRMSWAQFDAAVDRIARGLLAIGFGPGDRFGVWSTNWPEWVLLQFATARIGVVLVTVNPAYRMGELEYALGQSGVRGLALIERFKSSDYFQMLRQICPELDHCEPGALRSEKLPRLQWVIRIRGAEHPGMLAWQDLEGRGEREEGREREGSLPAPLSPLPCSGALAVRPGQPAIHLRHDRPAQRGRAEPSQPALERLLCGRRPAVGRPRSDLHPGAAVPLFRVRVGHDVRGGQRRRHGFSARELRQRGDAGSRRGRAVHRHLRRADNVHRRAATPGLLPPRTSVRCGRASWPEAPARSSSCGG